MAIVIRRWKERCAYGVFNQKVLGLSTIRIMGKAGDAQVQFPRITSLGALGTLEPDKQWVVQAAQAILTQACKERRTVLAATASQSGTGSWRIDKQERFLAIADPGHSNRMRLSAQPDVPATIPASPSSSRA